MALFKHAIPIVIENEGGYVDHPSDPGGATNHGISLRFLKRQPLDLGDVDGDGDIDADDIKKLTPEQANGLYERAFWVPLGLNGVERQAVATKVFDLAVNMGPRQATRLLQRALRGTGQRVEVDGGLGPETLGATNRARPGILLEQLRHEQQEFYAGLIEKNPRLHVFRTGWMDRALM